MALKRTVNRLTVLFCAFLMLAAARGALAQGDAGRGEVLADTCRGCHSIENYKNVYPTYYVPKLGGQNSAYIVAALAGYRSQQREHPTMRAQAGDMTNQEMQDIAAYFATYGEPQTGDTVGTAPGSANVCVSCHGESGISIAEIYPNLLVPRRVRYQHRGDLPESRGAARGLSGQRVIRLQEQHAGKRHHGRFCRHSG